MNELRARESGALEAIYRASLQSTAGKLTSIDELVERTVEAAEVGLEASIVDELLLQHHLGAWTGSTRLRP